MISIVVPTIEGREDHLARCKSAYEENTRDKFEWIEIHDRPTCGIAWQEGSELANPRNDFLHFTADDLEPHPWWDIAAVNYALEGYLPAPRILRPDGSLESCGPWEMEMAEGNHTNMTRIPFCTMEQWRKIGPMIPLHYYTDDWFSYRGRRFGFETVVARDYQFTHHHAEAGRGAGMSQEGRMRCDHRDFWRAVERDQADSDHG